MNFGHVPAPLEAWANVARTLLEPAARRGGYSWDEVAADLEANRAQLWIAEDGTPRAAMVTRRDGDTLEVWLAGGAVLSGCVPFLEIALKAAPWARRGRLTGRKGWARVLAPYGWQASGEDLVREL